MKYTFHFQTNSGTKREFTTDNLEDGMNSVMRSVFDCLGNGDGENGGAGSLWRCAREIYDYIKSGVHYCYADCEWWMDRVNDEPERDHTFIFRFSTVLDTNVTISGKDYEEAKRKSIGWLTDAIGELKEVLKSSSTLWDYDGNWTDEGDEEIPENGGASHD